MRTRTIRNGLVATAVLAACATYSGMTSPSASAAYAGAALISCDAVGCYNHDAANGVWYYTVGMRDVYKYTGWGPYGGWDYLGGVWDVIEAGL